MHNPVVCFIVGLLAAAGILAGVWTPGILFYRWVNYREWPWESHDGFDAMAISLLVGTIIVGGGFLCGTLFTALGCKILGV